MTNKTLIEELRQHLDISHNHEAGLIPWSTRAMIEKAADALEAQEWQPIETALKTGEKFIAYDPDECSNMQVCWWLDSEWGDDWYNEIEPTHWMPFPKRPEVSNGDN
jgi:hypothetical protein